MNAFRLQYVCLFLALAIALPPMTCCADSTAAKQPPACCAVHDNQDLGDSYPVPVDGQCDCCLKRVAVTAETVGLTRVDVQWQWTLPPLAIIVPATPCCGGNEYRLVAGDTSLQTLQCVWRI
ncbi:hypothetical protein [Symmachiella dynata]|uniref:hypothetical protein n=1 Tax=Symmachiella dynata TaxID=2527995 RepID=UPI0030EF5A0B